MLTGYSAFDPTLYKTAAPFYSSTTTYAGGINATISRTTATFINLYGSTTYFASTYFSLNLNHRGYLYAETSGAYNFTITGADDIASLWVGSNAYSGWIKANANINAAISGGVGGCGTYSVTLAMGSYTPFRIVFGQAQRSAIFQMQVAAPNGTVILNSATAGSTDILQYGCSSANNAPAFPAWGSETLKISPSTFVVSQ